MIRIRELKYRNLDIPELDLPDGNTAVIGSNGSGKTSLLRIIAGIAAQESGSVMINGQTPAETVVGWVNEYPDRNALFSRVYDEITSPLRFSHLPCSEVKQRVESAAARAGIGDLLWRQMKDLSGGEKAMVALLTALVQLPDILVLDEYDSHLDPVTMDLIEGLIESSSVSSTIKCTQNMDLAARSDQILILSKGRVRSVGTPKEVFASQRDSFWYPLSWRVRDAY